MDGEARKRFFLRYLPGLLPLTTLYVLLTAYRDFRDNFAVDIWKDLGFPRLSPLRFWRDLKYPSP